MGCLALASNTHTHTPGDPADQVAVIHWLLAEPRFSCGATLRIRQWITNAYPLRANALPNLDEKVHIPIMRVWTSWRISQMKITAQEEYGLRCVLRLAKTK